MNRRPRGRSGQDQSLSSRVFGGAVWSTVQLVVMLPVNFVGNLVVARLLGPGDLGQFVALMVFLSVSTPLLDFGFGPAMQQWAGRAVAVGDTERAETLFRKALGFHLLIQQPGILVAAAYLLRDSPPSYFWWFAALSVLGTPLSSVNYWLASHNRLAMGAKRSLAAGVLGNVALVAVAAAGGSPELMWIARLAAQLLPALAILFALTPADRRVLLAPRLPRHMPEGFWAFARPMWITVLLSALLASRTEVYVLQWNGLATAAGVFAVAFGLANQVAGVFAGVHASFAAAAVTLSGQSEERLARALLRGHGMFAVVASLALAGSAGLPWLVVPLYGEPYADAAYFVLPLAVAATLQLALTGFGVGAWVRRQRRRLLVTQAAAVVLDLGVAAALVPVIGLSAAVLGAAAGFAAVNVGLLLREVGPRRSLALVLTGPWATACCATALGVLAGWLVPGSWAAAVAASGVALVVQLLLLRTLHRSSSRELVDWLEPRVPPRVRRLMVAVLAPRPLVDTDAGGVR